VGRGRREKGEGRREKGERMGEKNMEGDFCSSVSVHDSGANLHGRARWKGRFVAV